MSGVADTGANDEGPFPRPQPHSDETWAMVAERAQEMDLRRQKQIREQRESIERLMAQLSTAAKIIWDDEQWSYDNMELVRGSLQRVIPHGLA